MKDCKNLDINAVGCQQRNTSVHFDSSISSYSKEGTAHTGTYVQDCRDDDDEGENVTRRNTWYNETLVITPSDMSAGCSTLSDGLPSSALTTESGTTASVSTTSQYPTLTLTPATTTDRSREGIDTADFFIVQCLCFRQKTPIYNKV